MNLIEKTDPYPHWELLDQETSSRLRVVPQRGGLVSEWMCNGQEILYFDRDRFLDEAKSIRGGIPFLFPICGSLPEDLLYVDGRKYLINQHGFARDIPWKLSQLENRLGFQLSLSSSDLTLSFYPFEFYIEASFELLQNSLKINVSIANLGNKKMPFSFGLHPYFRVSDLLKIRVEGVPSTCCNQKDMTIAQTKEQMALIHKGLDISFDAKGPLTIIDEAINRRIVLEYNYPYSLGVIWTDPPRPMICLEPWSSPRNSLITGDRKLSLMPNESMKLCCKISCL